MNFASAASALGKDVCLTDVPVLEAGSPDGSLVACHLTGSDAGADTGVEVDA